MPKISMSQKLDRTPLLPTLQTQQTIQFPSSNGPVTNQRARHCGPKPPSQTLASKLFQLRSPYPSTYLLKTGKALLPFCSSFCYPTRPRQPQQFNLSINLSFYSWRGLILGSHFVLAYDEKGKKIYGGGRSRKNMYQRKEQVIH